MYFFLSLPEFNLKLITAFYVTHASRALYSHDLSGEGINFGSHSLHTFLTKQGHGGPPRTRDQLNAVSTSKTT